jgi:prepilin signal peptidase PulO-like enzyme (type II secretory pathway)
MFLQFIFIFALGTVFGSFVSALTWRYPRDISTMHGRSLCPKCRDQIRWFDNIPLLSFLFLRGKCRNCKRNISLRYPLIELATGLGFVAILYFATTVQDTVIFTILFLILEAIFIIDLEHQIIPDSFVFTGIVIALMYFFIKGTFPISNFLVGLTASVFLLLIHLITKGRGMGLGDVKFAVFGGFLVGSRLFLIWLFLAFLTGAVTGIILILGKKAGMKSHIAFGPFLVAAIPLTFVYGEKILFWLHLG